MIIAVTAYPTRDELILDQIEAKLQRYAHHTRDLSVSRSSAGTAVVKGMQQVIAPPQADRPQIESREMSNP